MSEKTTTFETKQLPARVGYPAPDGSEIRLLPSMNGGGLCHCTLPPSCTSLAVRHKTVDEILFVLDGQGQVWRKLGEQEGLADVHPGVCLTIPVGTHFQFRNTGQEALCFVIATMPPWPGKEEAVRVPDHRPASVRLPHGALNVINIPARAQMPKTDGQLSEKESRSK